MKKIMITASAFLFSMTLATGAFAGTDAVTSHTGPVETRMQAQQHEVSGILPSDEILGKNIEDPEGKKLGKIKSLLVDVNSGKIGYAVVADHPVPWNAIRANAMEKKFTLNMSEDQFKKAPKGKSIASQDEEIRINDFYGVAPYWEYGGQMQQQQLQEQSPSGMEHGGENGSMGE